MVADNADDEPDEALCDGELDGEATPSLHSLVFSREGDACSVGTPSLRTIVPASFAASRRSGVGPGSGAPFPCILTASVCVRRRLLPVPATPLPWKNALDIRLSISLILHRILVMVPVKRSLRLRS